MYIYSYRLKQRTIQELNLVETNSIIFVLNFSQPLLRKILFRSAVLKVIELLQQIEWEGRVRALGISKFRLGMDAQIPFTDSLLKPNRWIVRGTSYTRSLTESVHGLAICLLGRHTKQSIQRQAKF